MKDPLQRPSGLASTLGPLELRVLEELWERGGASVRDLLDAFPAIAYTTLMTTADRLYRKGLLLRVREGRRFRYHPRWTRYELDLRLAGELPVPHARRRMFNPVHAFRHMRGAWRVGSPRLQAMCPLSVSWQAPSQFAGASTTHGVSISISVNPPCR